MVLNYILVGCPWLFLTENLVSGSPSRYTLRVKSETLCSPVWDCRVSFLRISSPTPPTRDWEADEQMNMDSPPSIQYCETLFLDAYDIQKQVQGPIHATVDVAFSFCFVEAQYVERFAKRSVFRGVTGRLAVNCSQTGVFSDRAIRRLGKKFLKRRRVCRTLPRTTVGRKHVRRHFRSCRNQAFLAIKRRLTLT